MGNLVCFLSAISIGAKQKWWSHHQWQSKLFLQGSELDSEVRHHNGVFSWISVWYLDRWAQCHMGRLHSHRETLDVKSLIARVCLPVRCRVCSWVHANVCKVKSQKNKKGCTFALQSVLSIVLALLGRLSSSDHYHFSIRCRTHLHYPAKPIVEGPSGVFANHHQFWDDAGRMLMTCLWSIHAASLPNVARLSLFLYLRILRHQIALFPIRILAVTSGQISRRARGI